MRTAAARTNAGFVSPHVPPVGLESRLTLASYNTGSREAVREIHLTPRQRDVLAVLCEGLSNKLICRRLNISSGTVKAHISSILRELGVSSRLQAVVAAREAGLVCADSESAE